MMKRMSKIHIPTPLRQYVGKQSTVEVKAGTVGEAMNALVAQHPDVLAGGAIGPLVLPGSQR
jgi:hypothetical protein